MNPQRFCIWMTIPVMLAMLASCSSSPEPGPGGLAEGKPQDTISETSHEPLLALPEEEAKYLQDVEHFGGFVLGDLAFPKLTAALKENDWTTFRSFLHDEFQGALFSADAGTERIFEFASFRVWDQSDELVTGDADAFVAGLKELRSEYAELEQVGVKVMRMRPETRGQFQEPWTGSLKISLAGKRDDGIRQYHSFKFNCRVESISEETPSSRGWLMSAEAFAGKHGAGTGPLMTEMTSASGIDIEGLRDNWTHSYQGGSRPFLTGGLYANDYNRDGHMDLMVTDVDGLFFYRGNGDGTFDDVTEEVGLRRSISRQIAVFGDFDGDGFEDLILEERVFHNVGGTRFEPVLPGQHNLDLGVTKASYAVVDYDRDGKLDLFVAGIHLHEGKDKPWIGEEKQRSTINKLYRNLGDWKFEDVSVASNTEGTGVGTFSAVWFDANGDDWPDYVSACEFGPNDYYLNNGDGTFRKAHLPGEYGGFSMGITVTDIDNDGLGDPYVANMYSKAGERIVDNMRDGLYEDSVQAKMRDFVSGNELYRNLGGGEFEKIGQAVGVNDVGWAYGTGCADLNSDGFPEIYAPVGFQSVSRGKPDG